MDLLRLKVARVRSGVSVDTLAQSMGVDRATVYRKLSGKSEFTLSELCAIKEQLDLDDFEFNSIFFNEQLTETQD